MSSELLPDLWSKKIQDGSDDVKKNTAVGVHDIDVVLVAGPFPPTLRLPPA